MRLGTFYLFILNVKIYQWHFNELWIKLGQEGALRNFLSRSVCAAVLIQSIRPHVIRK